MKEKFYHCIFRDELQSWVLDDNGNIVEPTSDRVKPFSIYVDENEKEFAISHQAKQGILAVINEFMEDNKDK